MKRNTLILVGLVIFLVLATLLVLRRPGEQSSTTGSSGTLFTIDSLAVDKIVIKSPSARTILEKHGIDWFIEEPIHYRADQNNVATVIQQAKNMEVHGVVSSNPQKQSVFQVDSTGTFVTMFEHGAEKANFIVGKASSSFTETYVRKPSSNDVVLVDGTLGFSFNRALRDWRDRTVLATQRETIREVRFQYGDTTFTLANKDSVWMVGKDSTDASAVNSLLSQLANITADDFADSVSTAPKVASEITFAGNQLRFSFRKELNKYFVQSSSSPQWFVFESWRANELLKRKKDLVKKK